MRIKTGCVVEGSFLHYLLATRLYILFIYPQF
jgi:hypothetical protein